MAHHLKLREDGSFTIVQFTDVHWQNGEEADLQSEELMKRILNDERPDLIMFTGDMIHANRCADPRESIRGVVRAAEAAEIPWAAVFGNHDDESDVTRHDLMAVMQEHSFCISEPGPQEIHGVGNFVLDIINPADGLPAASLYGFDSGAYAPARAGGYDWIRRSQIDWYAEHSSARAEKAGFALPSLAFFHIPIPEYKDLWDFHTCYGSKFESVGSPKINSGLFTAFVEMNDVIGTFCGHDHINDYWGDLLGIRLCYGRASGYNTYGREGFPLGARIIRFEPLKRSFDSWIRLVDGTVIGRQEEHSPVYSDREPYIEV
ncbi:metallophosphoesterase family protein [Paenibacillus spongiae]|uniref:Metallophosphoesterase family protein n=1 Tax=Paenibacillus spongiae TaxID=2909671 RepID=A0ABY5S6E2_9BACL|nr:metallophosphoesterase family protein [Paenibacillus spongiae]UVI29482.1 metallophosphoesterase family protein [Paenibacillus spongiae]